MCADLSLWREGRGGKPPPGNTLPSHGTSSKRGGKGVSLQFPIIEIMAIVRLLQGQVEEQEVHKVAQLLVITFSEKKVFSSLQVKKKKVTLMAYLF